MLGCKSRKKPKPTEYDIHDLLEAFAQARQMDEKVLVMAFVGALDVLESHRHTAEKIVAWTRVSLKENVTQLEKLAREIVTADRDQELGEVRPGVLACGA